MNFIKFLFLIFLSFNLINLSLNQLNGKCGYPGKPYRAKLEPDNKLQYDEGEEVTYQCTEFWSALQTRRCEKGKWSGQQPRCGDFVDGILMKDSKMEDISDPDNPVLKFEHLDMNITKTDWKYPNVFTSNRFKKARLRVYDTKKYKWSFKFTGPAVKLFVRINFNFINYTFLPQEVRDNFKLNISINVSPHRNCQLMQQTDDKWRENGRKMDCDFICDSISTDDFKSDIEKPGDYLFMETQSSLDITHDLIAVFFGKSYGTEDDPMCGEPEFSVSQYSRFNVQYKDYIIDCKSDKYKYISSMNDILPGTSIHGLKCTGDMKWNGSYPECVPKKPCSIESLLIKNAGNRTTINSMDGLYYFNSSQYYAVDGTEVFYGCFQATDILRGREHRMCLRTGLWSGTEPQCYNPNESTKFPVWLLIVILFSALIFIVCLTALLFYVYTKRIRNRITNQIENQNRVENENYDNYDDIDISGDKCYDSYDVVGEGGEVRYADPFYNAEKDYIQMPTSTQSSNSYWRIANSEYLEMTCSKSASPCSSVKVTPKDHMIYTYEF